MKLSQTPYAKKMRKMRRTETPSQKKKRCFHNRMMRISAQYSYARANSGNLRKFRPPTELELQALNYRKNHESKKEKV